MENPMGRAKPRIEKPSTVKVPAAQDFEKLGVFYLGRFFDLQTRKPKQDLVLYDSRNLTTHAVCVGMTGSGKTGLCLTLLEEAAIDGIPVIAIDPKGDLSNLLLTFPSLGAGDFAPWVNQDEARKAGLSSEDFAARQAELWRKGLAEWGQDGARIQRLRDAADFAIYTPGSNAGLAVSVLKAFSAPEPALRGDAEALRERIGTTATSLLAMLGIEADPVKSREHILISTILDAAWKQSLSLDLPALIQQIQTPPVTRIGVLDLDSFFPAKDRFGLAMAINNLLAAPGFDAWLQGEPLDIQSLLHTREGKPRVAIFSIAHLNDAERMFFVSLLLNQVVGWMRTLPGTTSLRALVYMDEIFGYLPPVANPPSKAPLLTLLKQARAFGVGIVLATQNPVDLDYKGLSNTGTWFIGRLQTERDKARVLEGLQGAAASTSSKFDRQKMEQTLAGLGNRIFLLHSVHEDSPEVFQVRWALCYLPGPLTRNQIKVLMDAHRAAGPTAAVAPTVDVAVPGSLTPSPPAATASPASSALGGQQPLLPPDVPQFFAPLRGSQPAKSQLLYRPMIFGCGQVYFSDAKAGVEEKRDVALLCDLAPDAVAVDWQGAAAVELTDSELEKLPTSGAVFTPLPPEAAKAKNYAAWKKALADSLYRTQKLEVYKSLALGEVSKAGESQRDFRVRLQQTAREERDLRAEKLRQKYAPKIAALEERTRRALQTVEKESEQARHSKLQTMLSFGTTVLGAFMGRKALSAGTLGKATTTARGVGRSMKDSQDVARAQENVEALRRKQADLDAQFQTELQALDTKIDPLTEQLETLAIWPKKTNISVRLVGLVWMPYWQQPDGSTSTAWE
jgi:hypothetical protein